MTVGRNSAGHGGVGAIVLALVLGGCRQDAEDHRANASPLAASDAAGNPNVALGMPVPAHPHPAYLLVRSQYVLSVNQETHLADWAAWRLRASDLGDAPRHVGAFVTDPSLPRGWYSVTHADYSHSGYDRGHLVPSQDRTATPADNDATFWLTNVAPQTAELNRGPWEDLEKYCRRLARRGATLYITAGPVYREATPTIGHGVAVPSAFWKVAMVLDVGATRAADPSQVIAVILPNTNDVGKDWRAYQVPVADIEQAAGLRLPR